MKVEKTNKYIEFIKNLYKPLKGKAWTDINNMDTTTPDITDTPAGLPAEELVEIPVEAAVEQPETEAPEEATEEKPKRRKKKKDDSDKEEENEDGDVSEAQ
jgi:hypothetical protein